MYPVCFLQHGTCKKKDNVYSTYEYKWTRSLGVEAVVLGTPSVPDPINSCKDKGINIVISMTSVQYIQDLEIRKSRMYHVKIDTTLLRLIHEYCWQNS